MIFRGDCKSFKLSNNKSNQILHFGEKAKLEFPEENLSQQSRKPRNSTPVM